MASESNDPGRQFPAIRGRLVAAGNLDGIKTTHQKANNGHGEEPSTLTCACAGDEHNNPSLQCIQVASVSTDGQKFLTYERYYRVITCSAGRYDCEPSNTQLLQWKSGAAKEPIVDTLTLKINLFGISIRRHNHFNTVSVSWCRS